MTDEAIKGYKAALTESINSWMQHRDDTKEFAEKITLDYIKDCGLHVDKNMFTDKCDTYLMQTIIEKYYASKFMKIAIDGGELTKFRRTLCNVLSGKIEMNWQEDSSLAVSIMSMMDCLPFFFVEDMLLEGMREFLPHYGHEEYTYRESAIPSIREKQEDKIIELEYIASRSHLNTDGARKNPLQNPTKSDLNHDTIHDLGIMVNYFFKEIDSEKIYVIKIHKRNPLKFLFLKEIKNNITVKVEIMQCLGNMYGCGFPLGYISQWELK